MSAASRDSVLTNTLGGIGITALICAVAVAIPIIGFFCLLLLPQPILFYRLKLGRRQGLLIIAAALLLIFIGTGRFFADAVFLVAMMGLGFCLAEFVEQELRVEKIIAYAAGAVIVGGLAVLMIYANLRNLSLTGFLSAYVAENLRMTIALYQKAGMAEESIRALENSLEQIAAILTRILPSLAAAGLLLTGWLNLLAARFFFNREERKFAQFRNLSIWQTPDAMVWVVAASIALLLLPSQTMKLISLNALVVLVVIYFFQGIAVVSFYFEKKEIPLVFRLLVYAVIAVQQFLLLIVAAVGFLDVWADFRRLGASPPGQPGEES